MMMAKSSNAIDSPAHWSPENVGSTAKVQVKRIPQSTDIYQATQGLAEMKLDLSTASHAQCGCRTQCKCSAV